MRATSCDPRWDSIVGRMRFISRPGQVARLWSTRGLLGGPQPLRKGLKQLPANRPVHLDQRLEVPEREAPAVDLAGRRDRRRTRALVDHRELAKRVAGAELRALLAANADRGLAALDEKERGTAGALADHGLAGAEATVLEEPRDLLYLLAREVGEQRHLLDDVRRRAWHQAVPARVTGRH